MGERVALRNAVSLYALAFWAVEGTQQIWAGHPRHWPTVRGTRDSRGAASAPVAHRSLLNGSGSSVACTGGVRQAGIGTSRIHRNVRPIALQTIAAAPVCLHAICLPPARITCDGRCRHRVARRGLMSHPSLAGPWGEMQATVAWWLAAAWDATNSFRQPYTPSWPGWRAPTLGLTTPRPRCRFLWVASVSCKSAGPCRLRSESGVRAACLIAARAPLFSLMVYRGSLLRPRVEFARNARGEFMASDGLRTTAVQSGSFQRWPLRGHPTPFNTQEDGAWSKPSNVRYAAGRMS